MSECADTKEKEFEWKDSSKFVKKFLVSSRFHFVICISPVPVFAVYKILQDQNSVFLIYIKNKT
jgi:hypothetical protein